MIAAVGVRRPAPTFSEFTLHTHNYQEHITAGPDGSLWFTETDGDAGKIGRITPAGKVSEFSLPGGEGFADRITAGPDGAVWFTVGIGSTGKIGRITPAGKITEFSVPTDAGKSWSSSAWGIAAGPDGALWFTAGDSETAKIDRITPAGKITEFAIPTSSGNVPGAIVAGPDGALWFVAGDSSAPKIDRMTPAGNVTEFVIPSRAQGIAAGRDDAVWFTEHVGRIGRITPAGKITEFPIPTAGSNPQDITAGPDGALWFTEGTADRNRPNGRIGRITPAGKITEFSVPTDSDAWSITPGSDGALWFTEELGTKIGRIVPPLKQYLAKNSIAPSPSPISEFAVKMGGVSHGIATGPDGALWFTLNKALGRITTGGTISTVPLPEADGTNDPVAIALGSDGALWFTVDAGCDCGQNSYFAGRIGRMTADQKITEFPVTTDSFPNAMTLGPDGALWFTEQFGAKNKIGRITTGGKLVEFVIPTQNGFPVGITSGPDGAVWFTESAGKIGRITPAGKITEFVIRAKGSYPFGITSGPDGALWFTDRGTNEIGRITLKGKIRGFVIPTPASDAGAITKGPDGALWFTESGRIAGSDWCSLRKRPAGCASEIGRITTAGTITEFLIPSWNASPAGIAVGPDGAVWFTESGANQIGRIVPPKKPAQ
jgi:streptogramin lyase